MKSLTVFWIWLATCFFASASTGAWNGVSFTALNGVAQTGWNGTAVSCANAVTTFYQDTASSSGGDGTSNLTSGSTRAFHDLAEAIDAASVQTALTAGNVKISVRCGSGADTSDVTTALTSGPTSSTHYLLIIAEGTARHAGVWTDSDPVYRLKRTNSKGIYQNITDNLHLDGLQVEITVTDTFTYEGIKIATANNGVVNVWADGCIVKAVLTNGSVNGLVARYVNGSAGNTQGRAVFRNCLTQNCTVGTNNDFPNVEIYGCTFAGGFYGMVADANTIAINNIVTLNSESAFVPGSGLFVSPSDYNLETNGSGLPGGSNSMGAHSKSVASIHMPNSGSGDYRTDSSSTDSYRTGGFNPAGDGLSLLDGVRATRHNPPSIGFNDP